MPVSGPSQAPLSTIHNASDIVLSALARIETEIAHAEEETLTHTKYIHQQLVFLSKLRAKRNSFLPVSRLPPETLGTIFLHGAREYHENDSATRFTCSVPSWVNVSYVCSHWREIALDCAVLWAYHFNLSPRWTEELLLRSKEASLKISCIYPVGRYKKVSWWPSLVIHLLKHSERIQDFRLHLPLSFLPEKLSFCAPLLENLEIHFFDQPDSEEFLAITNGSTPILRKLRLFRCPLPCSLNLSRLKTLSICDTGFPSGVSMADFLAALRTMKELTVLHLEYALPPAHAFLSSGGLGTSPKIDLPHLALLDVVAPLSTVIVLLSCVNIPLRTRLSLELLFEHGSSATDYTPISSFLAQQFRVSEQLSPSSGPVFRSLIIDTSDTASLTVSSTERDCHPHSLFEGSGCNIPLKIILREDADEIDPTDSIDDIQSAHLNDEQRIISDICCSLPLADVQSLHVLSPRFTASFWEEVLGHLHGLRYMKLSHGLMPDLSLFSLTAHESSESPSGQAIRNQRAASGHIFVPALEELELDHITFIGPDLPLWRDFMSQNSLFDALSTRKGLRDRLTMVGCRVSSDG